MDKNKKVQVVVLAGLVLTVIALFLTLYKVTFMGKDVSDSIFNAYKDQGKTGVIELRRTLNHYFSEICTS